MLKQKISKICQFVNLENRYQSLSASQTSGGLGDGSGVNIYHGFSWAFIEVFMHLREFGILMNLLDSHGLTSNYGIHVDSHRFI